MQLIVSQKKENPFLKRLELIGKVVFEGTTPSNLQVAELLAKETGKSQELVVMKKIHSGYGKKEADVLAFAYHDAGARKKAEVLLPHQKKKSAAPEEEKKE